MAGKIDNPLEASQGAWPESSEGLGKEFADAALALGKLVFPVVAFVDIFVNRFGRYEREGRARYLFQALVENLKFLEKQNDDAHDKIRATQERLETPRFREAVAAGLEESVRATSEAKIDQFAAVLAGSLLPNEWANPSDDLATMIRDVGQLGELDILGLEILETAFKATYGTFPNLNGTNQFVEHIGDLTRAIHKYKIHPDDFYGTCLRLSGFGLATEDRPAIRPNGERCFRLTRRGLALLGYLKAFPNKVREAKK